MYELCSRIQSALMDGVYSEKIPVDSGVVQGSIMGCNLFNTHISDVMDANLSTNSRLIALTDDLVLLRPIFNTEEDERLLQADLNVILLETLQSFL